MRNEKDRLPEHPSFPGNFPASVPRQWPRRMLMTPQMVAIGGLLAFLTVVLSMVVLPTTTYKPAYSENWLPLSESARNGRALFLSNGCVYCHSGFTRPQDYFRASSSLYSRISEPGDYKGLSQSPNLLGTVRTGPDLTNQGGQHPDGWHLSHYWNPRSTTPMSIMQRFNFLDDTQLKDLIAFNQSQGGKAGALRYAAVRTGNFLMRLNGGKAGLDDPDAPAQLIADLRASGELREGGKGSDKSPSGLPWMKVWHVNSFARSYWLTENPLPVTRQNLIRGKEVFQQRCVGCHGVKGDGKGPGADRLKVKPYDFTQKMSEDAGASSGMLYHRILTAGPGTAMENFGPRLSVEDTWRTVMFLQTIRQGGLSETLPSVEMYEAWSPPQGLQNYLDENPLSEMFGDWSRSDDPFMQAAQWLAPGMAPDDTIYVGGKLPITLERLAGAVRAAYVRIIDEKIADATARGEALPAEAALRDTKGLAFNAP